MLNAPARTKSKLISKDNLPIEFSLLQLAGFCLPLLPLMLLQIPLNSFLSAFYAEETLQDGVQVDLQIWRNLPHVWAVFLAKVS